MTKPPRTLGISLAIIAGVFLFSCLPLTQATILLSINARPGLEFLPDTSNGQNIPPVVGREVLDVNPTPLITQAAVAIAFFVTAILTWRGKPSIMRFIFVGIVSLLTAGNLFQLLSLLSAPAPTPQTGMDSANELSRTLAMTQLCVTLLIPAYIIWYLNRGPARAFFRGHYLEAPDSNPDSKR